MTEGGLREAQIERFKRLALPHLPVLLRVARYLTRHDHEAEDLAQEAMIKAMKAIGTFRDGTDIKAWLMTILRRLHIDRYRTSKKRQRDVSLDDVGAVVAESDPAGVFDDRWHEPEDMLDRFEDQAVIDALKSLPEEIRWTLLLVDVEQLGQDEAARIMQIPVGTVKSRAHRGRKMLRDRLYKVAQKRGWVPMGEGETP